MKFDLKYVEKLVKMLSDSDLTELTLEDSEQTIILKKDSSNVKLIQAEPMAQQAIGVQPAQVEATETPAVEPAKKGKPIKSPMVGTFYKSPSPDAPPFIEVGGVVAKGEVVCIIEAMKLMNEIESDFSGKIVEICVENGQPVEYGQVLMYIE